MILRLCLTVLASLSSLVDTSASRRAAAAMKGPTATSTVTAALAEAQAACAPVTLVLLRDPCGPRPAEEGPLLPLAVAPGLD